MFRRSAGALALATTLTFGLSSALVAQTATQDMKNAGHDTKNAASNAGHGVATGTKKAYHSTKHGTKKAYHRTSKATKDVGHDLSGKPNTSNNPQ